MANLNKEKQTTNAILMVRPDRFGFNAQTAESNAFQNRPKDETDVRDKAMAEFRKMVAQLEAENIAVYTVASPQGRLTPDAVFPNNWISFHNDEIVLYPMLAPNRREERQPDQVMEKLKAAGKQNLPEEIVDLTYLETFGNYLEGTGSLVLDREKQVAFANLSARTDEEALSVFGRTAGYHTVAFRSTDKEGNEIYHTNVIMSVGKKFTVVCLESMSEADQQKVLRTLNKLGKDIIPITRDQMNSFCGNILEVDSLDGQSKIVMSDTAYNAFTAQQRKKLESYGKPVVVSIPTIEKVGGGSARCMMAEVFPPETR